MNNKIVVFHNNSCSKSRAVLEFLDENGMEFEVINFVETPLSTKDLKSVIDKLGVSIHEVIRKNEPLYKENFEGKLFSDEEWLIILTENPSLIQRPILVKGSFAMIGRPVEDVRKLIDR